MKTIKELRKRRGFLESEVERYRFTDKKIVKQAVAEVVLIDLCIRYLETDPAPEFIDSELRRIKAEVVVINGRYGLWDAPQGMDFKNETARRAYYREIMDVPRRKKYIKTLSYLINETN